MSWAAILAALFKPVILPILTALVGWLIPSPLQRAAKAPVEVADAEKKADAGDTGALDHL